MLFLLVLIRVHGNNNSLDVSELHADNVNLLLFVLRGRRSLDRMAVNEYSRQLIIVRSTTRHHHLRRRPPRSIRARKPLLRVSIARSALVPWLTRCCRLRANPHTLAMLSLSAH